jgi:hypothetical protein
MLRTISTQDSGIIKWLVYSGISGEGTITHALNGGDVKLAIYLHKLMFEAMIRTKIFYLEKSGLLLISENLRQKISSLQDDILKENFNFS